MVTYSDLTDRDAVERAIAEFDQLGRDAFLHKYGFGEARDFFLVTEEGRYDTKPIFAAAYEYQHGVPVSSKDIHGGPRAAAGRLAELGYTVEGIDDKKGRRTFDTFEAALAEFSIPFENLPKVREFLSGRTDKEFYIPASGTYIAAVPAEGKTLAFIHSGYIWHRVAKGQGEFIELPVNRLRDGGYARRRRAAEAATATVCRAARWCCR